VRSITCRREPVPDERPQGYPHQRRLIKARWCAVTHEVLCQGLEEGLRGGVRPARWNTPAPQTATIKSLPVAFEAMKAMQAEDVEWGGDYRGGAAKR
jgi:hypothetical protein